MFVVLVGTVVTFIESIAHPNLFDWSITAWLFLTVIFANFAEGMAEGRGKAQAETLRRMRSETEARRLRPDGLIERVPASALSKGDMVVAEAGDIIPSDGEITEGIASVDESAITGESAPVIRRVRWRPLGRYRRGKGPVGPDRGADHGRAGADVPRPDDRSRRRRQPAEDPKRDCADHPARRAHYRLPARRRRPATVRQICRRTGVGGNPRLAARMLDPDHDRRACCRPSASREWTAWCRRNVLAMSGRAVEAAGDVQTLLLDKTGTITLGNRQASAFIPVKGHTKEELAAAPQLASLADDTPEGRSIVVLAKDRFGIRGARPRRQSPAFVPFSRHHPHVRSRPRRSADPQGAAESVAKCRVTEKGGTVPPTSTRSSRTSSRSGGTPLVGGRWERTSWA